MTLVDFVAFIRAKWDNEYWTTSFPIIGDCYDRDYYTLNNHHCIGLPVKQQSPFNRLLSYLHNFSRMW